MALPKDMRLKGHRTFNYIHKNSTTYHGKLMTFKVARSNPEILLKHKLKNTPNKSGLYQFHSFGQPKGKSVSTYLGSWTIGID